MNEHTEIMEALGMNTNINAWKEHDKLTKMIETGENIDPGSEVEKLYEYHKEKGIQKFHISLAPNFDGTAEDLARSTNKMYKQMDDPVQGLIGRIKGHIFLKSDYISCTENRKRILENGDFLKLPMNESEKRKVKSYKEDIDLFEKAIDLIQKLDSKEK